MLTEGECPTFYPALRMELWRAIESTVATDRGELTGPNWAVRPHEVPRAGTFGPKD